MPARTTDTAAPVEPATRSPRARSTRPRLALAMMVLDEVEVLERCLASVRPYIDAWTIMDTGSVDGTPELAQSLLEGLPGRVVYEPWRDFGSASGSSSTPG